MRNLIISSGYSYPPSYMRVFLKSIAKNAPTTDVVLFYHDASAQTISLLQEYLSTVNVVQPSDYVLRKARDLLLTRGKNRILGAIHRVGQVIERNVGASYLPLLTATYDVILARYFWASHYLRNTDINKYDYIMLSDCRDVVIQSDPFEKINGNYFISGAEEKRIEECTINQNWIYETYGADVLRNIKGEWIICSGVSIGSRSLLVAYVSAMANELKRMDGKLVGRVGGDQAIHNYIIRTKALNFEVQTTKSVDGIIATLHHYDEKCIGINGNNIVIENGVIPSVVHQYDRFCFLREHCAEIY
jgi:hypothetical protein